MKTQAFVKEQGDSTQLIFNINRANHPAQSVFVDAELTIGRAVANRIRLDDDPAVDRSHARVVRADGQWLITCIEVASNLTPIGETGSEGMPIRELQLKPGVRFRIGSAEFDCESASGYESVGSGALNDRPCPLCNANLPSIRVGIHACPDCQGAIFAYRQDPQGSVITLIPGDCGSFRLDCFVAVGGMGTVFHAVNRESGTEAAVKILTKDNSESNAIPRFLNEVETLRKVKSERIVQLLGSGRTKVFHFLAMEWVNGESLQEKLDTARKRNERITSPHLLAWMEQISLGIADIHRYKIVHRDLKPANILFTRQNQIKIADFGVARQLDAPSLTTAGKSLGTIRYMSPEQLNHPDQVDTRSDQFALGVLLHELLSGEAPHIGKIDTTAISTRRFPPDINRDLHNLLGTLLAANPEERFPDVSQLPEKFRSLRDRVVAAKGSTTEATEPDPLRVTRFRVPESSVITPLPPRRSAGMLALLVFFFIAALGGIASSAWALLSLNSAQSKIVELTAKISGLNSLQETNAQLTTEIDELKSSPATNTDLTANINELNSLKATNTELAAKVTELQDKLKEAQQSPTKTPNTPDLAPVIETLKTELEEIKSELHESEAREKQLEKAKKDLEKANRDTKSKLGNFESLNQRIKELTDQLNEEKQRTSNYIRNKKTLKAGIEVGSRGVKGVVVRQTEQGVDFEIEEKAKLNSALVDGSGHLSKPSREDTCNAVANIVERLMLTQKTEGLSQYYFALSSGVVASVANSPNELDQLRAEISESVQSRVAAVLKQVAENKLRQREFPFSSAKELEKQVRLIRPDDEAEYAFLGLAQMRHWSETESNECILIDVGSGNTKGGYYEFPDGKADALPFFRAVSDSSLPMPGTITLSTMIESTHSEAEIDELLIQRIVSPFERSIRRKPRLTNAKRAILSGGAVWALTTLRHPEAATDRIVPISIRDIDEFVKMTSGDEFPQIVTAGALSEKAMKDIADVKQVFTPRQLHSGALLLSSIAKACRMKEQKTRLEFHRDSLYAWIAHLASQSAPDILQFR